MTVAGPERYEFGEFLVEPAERRLCLAGDPISIPPKTYDLLVALLRRAGKLATKQELLATVWPESFVEEGILAVHISALRKVLNGKTSAARYIETVPRSGYRFSAPIVARHFDESRNSEAAVLCVRGKAHLRAASVYEAPKALAAFQAAVDVDPSCAPAHAGMALAYCALAQGRMAQPRDVYAQAKVAALRALAMDPSCADAQTALGAVLFFGEWDWQAAEKSLRRAIELDPAQTEALLICGQVLDGLGRLDSGLEMKRKALEIEPCSPRVHLAIALSCWNQRRFGECIDWANKALALDPAHPHAREFLAGAWLKKGDADRWLAENIAHARAHGVPAAALEPLRQAFANGGGRGLAKLFIARASQQPQAFPAMQMALQYAAAGDFESAFTHLDRAIDARDPGLVDLAVAPQWDDLRADHRFLKCLSRMRLRPVWLQDAMSAVEA